MSRFDIAIIGSGPAGISAAITAKVRNKDIILFGSGMSEKVTKAHSVLNYTGLPNVSGEALADALFKHLESLNIEITRERVTAVLSMGDYFALQTSADNIYEARTVILATGTVQLLHLINILMYITKQIWHHGWQEVLEKLLRR